MPKLLHTLDFFCFVEFYKYISILLSIIQLTSLALWTSDSLLHTDTLRMICTAATYVNSQQKLQTFLLKKKKKTLAIIDFHALFIFYKLTQIFRPQQHITCNNFIVVRGSPLYNEQKAASLSTCV